MREAPSVNLTIRKSEGVAWFLNTVGPWLNRILPAWILARLWGRWLGWLPLLRYRIDGQKEWTLVTVREALDREMRHRTGPTP